MPRNPPREPHAFPHYSPGRRQPQRRRPYQESPGERSHSEQPRCRRRRPGSTRLPPRRRRLRGPRSPRRASPSPPPPSADPPALTLLDLKLPKIPGLDVLRHIRALPLLRRTTVVILTSSREEQHLAISYDLGVNSYIRKPVDFNQFTTAIEQLGLYWLLMNEPPPPPPIEAWKP